MNGETLLEQIRSTPMVDLTYSFTEKMPYWPGRLQEPFSHTVEEVRPRVWGGCFTMAEHMGTHVDAPRHFVADGRTTAELRLDEMISLGVVIDVSDKVDGDPDYSLTVDDVFRWERQNDRIAANSAVLLHTGWGRRWHDPGAYLNKDGDGVLHFPGFSGEAARFFIEERRVNVLGLDTLSADNMVTTIAHDSPVHRRVQEADGRIIENLARLDELPPRGFILVIASILIEGGTGAPARVFALIP
ncbi:MAG: cyclase family protein [Acidobacteria bacterium]|nr:cyclase family protein [Acidobacteriota bacterium]